MSAISALSSASYYDLVMEGKHKTLVHSALTWRIAARSLVRKLSATSRIVILLSIMFTLLTISVAGGIIANDTSSYWIQRTINKDTIALAHVDIGNQFAMTLSTFSGAKITGDFNYSDPKYAISNAFMEGLVSLSVIKSVNEHLFLREHIREISNFTIIDGREISVGDSREGDAVVIGLNPQKSRSEGSIQGRDLEGNATLEAVIGDSVAQTMYSPDSRKHIDFSDPLVQSIEIGNTYFRIVGVSVDPMNNGQVVYVPIDRLMNSTGIVSPNLLMITLDSSVNREEAITSIENFVKANDLNVGVFDLSPIVEQNTSFLSMTWRTIMLLPLLTLLSSTLCLVGYVMLALDEQRQEFAMLRAIGAKPRMIVKISAIQSAIILCSSFAVGISFGVIITLIILMTNPVVTTLTITFISIWLVSALISIFLLSLYPAFRLAKSPILKIIS